MVSFVRFHLLTSLPFTLLIFMLHGKHVIFDRTYFGEKHIHMTQIDVPTRSGDVIPQPRQQSLVDIEKIVECPIPNVQRRQMWQEIVSDEKA